MTIVYDNPHTYKDEMAEFIKDCVYAVESNSFEDLTLWKKYHKEVKWEQINAGFVPTIGMLGDRPVCVSIHVSIIDGHRVLFYNACSQVVDHVMVGDWVKARIKNTKFTDAGNFHNVINHINDLNKGIKMIENQSGVNVIAIEAPYLVSCLKCVFNDNDDFCITASCQSADRVDGKNVYFTLSDKIPVKVVKKKISKERIVELALKNGFKLKPQPDGVDALNPYVFDFVSDIVKELS